MHPAAADLEATPLTPCAQCLRLLPMAELMAFANYSVCAECKPEVVRRVARNEPVGRLWRAGNLLVLVGDTNCPDRCLYCNEAAVPGTKARTVRWTHPAWFLLIPLFPALMVVLVFGQATRVIEMPLCPLHTEQRSARLAVAVCILAAAIPVGYIVGLLEFSHSAIFIAGAVCVLLGLIVMARYYPILRATRITPTHAFFRGAGIEFLRNLPEWTKPARVE